jgi:hypothetical protein
MEAKNTTIPSRSSVCGFGTCVDRSVHRLVGKRDLVRVAGERLCLRRVRGEEATHRLGRLDGDNAQSRRTSPSRSTCRCLALAGLEMRSVGQHLF